MNNKYKSFIEYFDWLVQNCKEPVNLPDEVQDVYNLLCEQQNMEKPMFTESGLAILEYLQSCDATSWKAKDIADGMVISSRKISGAIRKLVTDGFVDKYGQNPVIYSLTEKGKNFDIDGYKNNLNEN
nr:MAG TPA: Transcriptional regulator, MarR/EmrR family, emrR, transcriptional regulator, DNA-binding [Caudoviricetes sp.]